MNRSRVAGICFLALVILVVVFRLGMIYQSTMPVNISEESTEQIVQIIKEVLHQQDITLTKSLLERWRTVLSEGNDIGGDNYISTKAWLKKAITERGLFTKQKILPEEIGLTTNELNKILSE
jgi:Na+-transporting methylmalonyl-CoA/oxaloacetate decarboxylase gamma subunit